MWSSGLALTDPESDEELMRRVAQGDARAGRSLHERHGGRVAGAAGRLLRNRADIEEVVQEAFLRLWRSATRWEPRAHLGTWLHRVAVNLSVDRLRRPVYEEYGPAHEQTDPAPTPEQVLSRLQVGREVAAALARLPERQRAALALVYDEALPQGEAAARLGVSVDALESLLARARRRLRGELAHLRPDPMED